MPFLSQEIETSSCYRNYCRQLINVIQYLESSEKENKSSFLFHYQKSIEEKYGTSDPSSLRKLLCSSPHRFH